MGEQALPTRTQAQSKSMPRASASRGAMNRWIKKWMNGVSATALVLGTMASFATTGCAVSESDVKRWETTERGPYKLVAVVTHDKYSWQLRTDAAMALIRMPPRGGRRQGIGYLCDHYKDEESAEREGALVQLGEEPRKKIVNAMAPEIIREMLVPPPAKKADGTIPADPSIPFKDAAFAMLSHEPSLVTDEKTKTELIAALNQWTQTDFENRIENPSQQYGVEQIMRFLGAPSVRGLAGLFTDQQTKLDKISGLIADLGDPDTKQKASENIVVLAKKIDSADWINKQKPIVEDADKRAGQKVTPAQLDAQVKQYQDQELTKVFSAMKRIGGRPVVEYAIVYGTDAKNSPERRTAALAAIEGRIDKGNTADIDRLFAIAKDDNTPDAVRDLAFSRLGELPKEIVNPKLYTLFDGKKWKVRWVAASAVLKTMNTKEVPDFMRHLPASAATKMGMSEPISYGAILNKLDAPAGAPKPRDVINTYLNAHELGPKLSALGAFYGGKKADIPAVAAHEGDTAPVPKCEKDDECGWSCDVPKPGSQETDSKTITTVGEFAKFCVIPSMISN
jgi:hypothetical protein